MATNRDARKSFSLETFLAAFAFSGLALATVYFGTRKWMLPIASRHGFGIDSMMIYLLISTGLLFLVGHLILSFIIWKYSGAQTITMGKAPPRTERRWSIALGILMALIAEGGVLVIGLPVWSELYGAPPDDAIRIEITGEQFAWNVRYPGADGKFGRTRPDLLSLDNPVGIDDKDPAAADDLLLLGVVYLPVDRPAAIRLLSKDVIHSFYLPHFRVKQDAVPGMAIDTWFVPTEKGSFEIACTELCGFGHFQMRGVLEVVSQEDYDLFLSEELPFLGE